jgi:hypothetical protein
MNKEKSRRYKREAEGRIDKELHMGLTLSRKMQQLQKVKKTGPIGDIQVCTAVQKERTWGGLRAAGIVAKVEPVRSWHHPQWTG